MYNYTLTTPTSTKKSSRQEAVALPALPLGDDPATALLDRLPRIELAALESLNLIFGPKRRIDLEWPDGSLYEIDFFSGFTHRLPGDQSAELVIEALLGPHSIRIGLVSADFLELLDGVSAALLPPEIKCALLESSLDEVIWKFEQAAGLLIRVTGVIHSPKELPDRGYNLFFDVQRKAGRSSTSGYLSMDLQGLDCLAGLLKHQPPPLAWERIDHLRIPMSFVLGTTRLRPSEIDRLAGDVIVLIDGIITAGSQEPPIRIDVAGRPFWLAIKTDSHLVVERKWEHAMEAEAIAPQAGQEHDGIVDLEDLELELVFELGRKPMSLAELRRIGPGYTFDLAGDITKPVSILLNGGRIGEGELVIIDNRLGVRLTQYLQRQESRDRQPR